MSEKEILQFCQPKTLFLYVQSTLLEIFQHVHRSTSLRRRPAEGNSARGEHGDAHDADLRVGLDSVRTRAELSGRSVGRRSS